MTETRKTAEKQSAGEKAQAGTQTIRLFKDNSRYKGDVFVSVNGRNYQIRRGMDVEVPDEVAEVLANSAAQDAVTARRLEQAAAQAQQ